MGMVSLNIQKPCPQFVLGFLLINAYIPGILGASLQTGWLFLLITLPLVMFQLNIDIKYPHIYGGMFIAYSALSFIWTLNFDLALYVFLQTIALALIFCIGACVKDIRWFIIGLAVGLLPSDVIGTIQYFYHVSPVITLKNTPAGLFVNQNIFCEVSASILISLVVLKLWVYIPFTLPGIIYVHSRGALLSIAIGVCLIIFRYSKKLFYWSLVGIFPLGFLIYHHQFSLKSIQERFSVWADTINGINLFGNGVGSFAVMYPYYATHVDTSRARPYYAHNDILQAVYEYGIGSIFFLIFLFLILRIKNDKITILLSILTMAMFNSSLHNPTIGFIWFMVAGFVTRDMPSIRDIGNNRGSYLFNGFTTERT